MHGKTTDRARIVAPPPVIYLGVLGAGLLLEWVWPTRPLLRPVSVAAGLALFMSGVVGLTSAIRTLLRAGTPVDPFKPTTAIVTDGLFRYSRNPIYASDLLLYVGLAVALNAGWALALTPVALWVMNTGVIAREESYLERRFGDEYLRYKQRVRRWL